MVEIWIPYGLSEVPVRVPEERLVEILTPNKTPPVPDLPSELKRLFESSNFLDSAKSVSSICMVIGASSRKAVTYDVANTVIDNLTSVGVPKASVTLLRTTDAPSFDQEAIGEIRSTTHDPTAPDAVPVQDFKGEIIPHINPIFVKSDLRIIIGELKPHSLLGRTGLCDIVFPGLASFDSVRAHLGDRKGITAPDLHKERMKVAKSIGNLFAIGFLLDSEKSLGKIAFGDMDRCMEDLEQHLQTVCSRRVSQSADIVVMGVGGKPMDESLLRAVEGFPVALPSVKRDGVVIVAAECPLGHGGGEFYDWCVERKEARYLEARLRHAFNYGGLKAAFLSRILQNHRIYLISTIPDHYVEGIFGMRAAATVNSALQSIQRTLGSDSTISVIPDASSIMLSQAKSEESDSHQTSYLGEKTLHES